MSTAGQNITSDLEQSLRSQFAVREEEFAHGSLKLRMLLPQKAEDLLDEEAFKKDERMPYWADLWPSGRGLARWLLDQPAIVTNVIEIGCGLALPALALRSRYINVLATDYNIDALRFAQCNAQRNGLGDLQTLLLDWRNLPDDFGRFDLVIAADVLYEQRNAIALVDLLPQIVHERGRVVLADPGRRWAGEFRQRMRQTGWNEIELKTISEPPIGAGTSSQIRIAEWRMRDTAG